MVHMIVKYMDSKRKILVKEYSKNYEKEIVE